MQSACVILSSVACPAVQYFFTLSHRRKDFRGGGVIDPKMCVLVFAATFVCNIFHSKKRTRYKIYIGLHLKYSLFLSDFNET